jgi:hypothetical protein
MQTPQFCQTRAQAEDNLECKHQWRGQSGFRCSRGARLREGSVQAIKPARAFDD